METEILRPKHETLEIKGRISYNEGAQAWNTIRFKKDLLQEFPQLKEKRSAFSYNMALFRSYKMLIKRFKEMQQKDEPLSILLFFCKEHKEEIS